MTSHLGRRLVHRLGKRLIQRVIPEIKKNNHVQTYKYIMINITAQDVIRTVKILLQMRRRDLCGFRKRKNNHK
jgi:hypothetical protein